MPKHESVRATLTARLPAKLRPAKVRSALTRRLFERRLGALDADPATPLVDHGTPYGGWALPADTVQPGWVCYSVGAGGDVSFDAALLEQGATVRAVEPVAEYVERARSALGDGAGRYTILEAALHGTDEPLRMRRHQDADSQALASTGLYETGEFVTVRGRTLGSLMAEFGDERIDLLKIDVEGAEYELVPTLDLQALGVRVLLIQVHHNQGLAAGRRLIDVIRAKGYRYVGQRPVVKLTFLREG